MSLTAHRTTPDRLAVRKTYKLYIGGTFPRSESGRTYVVTDSRGAFLANAAQGSCKDARDAVVAARAAFAGWAGATAFNRGQVLYRVAELMEGRRAEFVDAVARGEGLNRGRAEKVVDTAIDRWVWYAGWTDKVAQVGGNANPVAGPYFNFSAPEPTGVVAVLAPQDSSLLGLVNALAPPLVTGNAVVVLTSEDRPLPAIALAEVLATSDVPGGVVNVITGHTAEVAPWLAAHADVNALDVTGALGVEGLHWSDLQSAGAGNLKRVLVPSAEVEPDPGPVPGGPGRILFFTETKTVWHPTGV